MANQCIRYIGLPNGDKVSFTGPQFVECESSASSRDKIVTLNNIPSTGVPIGFTFNVLMDNAQEYDGHPMLKIQSGDLEMRNIYIARINGTLAEKNEWQSGDVLTLVYGYYIESSWPAALPAFFIVNGSSHHRANNLKTFGTISINGNVYHAGDPYEPNVMFNANHFVVTAEESLPEYPDDPSYLGNISIGLKVATVAETRTYLGIS
jgi:hypothetical protein